jgi:hypothetical protein
MSFVEDIGTRSAPGKPGEVLDDPYPSAGELFHLTDRTAPMNRSGLLALRIPKLELRTSQTSHQPASANGSSRVARGDMVPTLKERESSPRADDTARRRASDVHLQSIKIDHQTSRSQTKRLLLGLIVLVHPSQTQSGPTLPDDLVERPLVAGQSVEQPDDGCLLSRERQLFDPLTLPLRAAATYCFSYTATLFTC